MHILNIYISQIVKKKCLIIERSSKIILQLLEYLFNSFGVSSCGLAPRTSAEEIPNLYNFCNSFEKFVKILTTSLKYIVYAGYTFCHSEKISLKRELSLVVTVLKALVFLSYVPLDKGLTYHLNKS